MKTIDKFYTFIITIFIVSLCCSLIYGWVPIFRKTWLFVLLISVFSLLFYVKGLKLKFLYPLILYGVILYINVLSGDQKFNIINSSMEFFCFISVSYVFYVYSNNRFYNARLKLLEGYVFIIIITFIGTLIVYLNNPEVLRMIQSERNAGVEDTLFVLYSKLGVESYSMGHALPCLIPILVYSIKRGNGVRYKLLGVVILFVIVALVIMSTAATALLLSIILLLISFIWNEKNKIRNAFATSLLIFVTIFLITDRNLIGSKLNSINIDSESTYGGKISDFQDYATYGVAGNQTQGRFDLYMQSLNVFFKYPIFGTNNKLIIGDHSIFFDRLAMLGLVGFIPLLIYLNSYMRYVLKMLSTGIKPYCVLGFGHFIIMGCLKNIFDFEYISICLLIMPLVCMVVDNTTNNK